MSFFFFKQKTAYEMRISDWSSDVCSSDLVERAIVERQAFDIRFVKADRRRALAGFVVDDEIDAGQLHLRPPAAQHMKEIAGAAPDIKRAVAHQDRKSVV